MTKKLFISVLLIFVVLFGVFADGDITVAVDSSRNYDPTEIVNGQLTYRPSMKVKYNGTIYETSQLEDNFNVVTKNAEKIYNGVDEGWNTTEIKTHQRGFFEYTSPNTYDGTHTMTTISSGALDMNVHDAAVLWQDLSTNGGDIIRWTLDHAVSVARAYNSDAEIQNMRVEVGAPIRDDQNEITPCTGYGTTGNDLPNSQIIASTLGKWYGTDVSTGVAEGTYAYGNSDEVKTLYLTLTNDTVNGAKSQSIWRKAKGVYIVPAGQTVTRFAFISEAKEAACGNELSNLTFDTLLGNLHSQYNTEGDLVVSGYWGETDPEKKLVIKSGSKDAINVDMTTIVNSSKKDFVVTIPEEYFDTEAGSIAIYHQDYPTAVTSVKSHKWVYFASPYAINAYCCSPTCNADTCDYYGKDHAVSMSLLTNKHIMSAVLKSSDSNEVTENSVRWESSAPSVAKVDSSTGVIIGVSTGNATITAFTNDGIGQSKSVEVNVQ